MRVKIWFELKTDHSPVRIEKEITLSRPEGQVLTETMAAAAINHSISKLIEDNINSGFEGVKGA